MGHDVLSRFERAEISAEVALMELLVALEDARAIDALLLRESAGSPLVRLWRENRARCEQLVVSLRAQSSPDPAALGEPSLARVRALFDTLVAQSEEASVALYSLGNPEILAAATRELVTFLCDRQLAHQDARVLDFGCGIGRLEQALSPHVAHIHGLDLSPAMIESARRRCAGLANVQLSESTGRDLTGVASASYSLALVVDSFPYVVEAGAGLASTMGRELSRVLMPGGDLVIFNYSYRDDVELDRAELRELSRACGLEIELLGVQPLSLWNGRLFWLRRPTP